jgi:hypothetical protein
VLGLPEGAGWWQASDGNWYPPQESAAAPVSAIEKPRTRKLIAMAAVAVLIAGLGAAVFSLRSSADRWQRREHEQHARADGLANEVSSSQAQLDTAHTDLTAAREWARDASAALHDYETCVEDTNALMQRIGEDIVTGNPDPGLDAEGYRVQRECDQALSSGQDVDLPPVSTS